MGNFIQSSTIDIKAMSYLANRQKQYKNALNIY
jgi:hypothetical protein